ncbi:Pepsin-retropepsin like protein [Abeliophyllum distichum]|uniref:Pepsin-retropepsin like protein n=1 Tax=Abeliophyllum distichum TaxID=126358 RepID=A0ABD1UNQ7_9LAMI
MKARRYEKGLLPEVRQIVSSHALPTFRAVVKMAQTVTFSGLKVKVQGQQNDSGKRNWQDQNRNQISGQFKRQNQGPIRVQSSNTIPQCPKCKKNHNGDRYFGKNVCYRCGEPGHYVLQCRAGANEG